MLSKKSKASSGETFNLDNLAFFIENSFHIFNIHQILWATRAFLHADQFLKGGNKDQAKRLCLFMYSWRI